MTGETREDVAKWIRVGQFGLWKETARLNDIASTAAKREEGFGEAIGRTIHEVQFPHRDISIAAAGWRCGVPVTCHASIGSDIFHGYPNASGAALGEASHTDFLIFSRVIQDLEGGVFLNVGSAVTGPEVYLKALSMARNVARQRGEQICNFTTAVFDVVELPEKRNAVGTNGFPGRLPFCFCGSLILQYCSPKTIPQTTVMFTSIRHQQRFAYVAYGLPMHPVLGRSVSWINTNSVVPSSEWVTLHRDSLAWRVFIF